MSLMDELRDQLPRSLKDSEIMIPAYRVGDPVLVTFKANGHPVELKVDSKTA